MILLFKKKKLSFPNMRPQIGVHWIRIQVRQYDFIHFVRVLELPNTITIISIAFQISLILLDPACSPLACASVLVGVELYINVNVDDSLCKDDSCKILLVPARICAQGPLHLLVKHVNVHCQIEALNHELKLVMIEDIFILVIAVAAVSPRSGAHPS